MTLSLCSRQGGLHWKCCGVRTRYVCCAWLRRLSTCWDGTQVALLCVAIHGMGRCWCVWRQIACTEHTTEVVLGRSCQYGSCLQALFPDLLDGRSVSTLMSVLHKQNMNIQQMVDAQQHTNQQTNKHPLVELQTDAPLAHMPGGGHPFLDVGFCDARMGCASIRLLVLQQQCSWVVSPVNPLCRTTLGHAFTAGQPAVKTHTHTYTHETVDLLPQPTTLHAQVPKHCVLP